LGKGKKKFVSVQIFRIDGVTAAALPHPAEGKNRINTENPGVGVQRKNTGRWKRELFRNRKGGTGWPFYDRRKKRKESVSQSQSHN